MIPELQLDRMRLEIALVFQIGRIAFPHVMVEKGYRYNERKMALTIVLYNFE